jgi:coproporphyrinogen III oxidase-like Fe-S oxidoreductase
VSPRGAARRRNTPRLNGYLSALGRGEPPEREVELLDGPVRDLERVMLALRLDTGLLLSGAGSAIDEDALARFERLGLASRRAERDGLERLVLTPRGRRLGGAVTAELLA